MPLTGRLRRTVVLAVTAVLAASSGALAAPGAAGTLVTPDKDPFYRYDGKVPLARVLPGTPLKTRAVTLGADVNVTPVPAAQILYRTTDAVGRPTVSVTTYLTPVSGTVAPRVVGYLSFYDALGPQCDPSYTLRGGNPGANNQATADVEQAVATSLRAMGYVVTVPDFENVTLDYVAGTESGMSALDGVRATEAVLGLPAATPVGLMGYSGGSIAADWAAELAPRYAPALNLVGVALGGVPANLRNNLAYIDGSPSWSDATPGAMIGISRAFHISLAPYLSDWGRKVVGAMAGQCIGDFLGAWPGLTMKHLLKPQYANFDSIPVFRRTLDQLVMGSAPGHPNAPMLLVAGNSDGTGDGVMVAADERALASQYCGQGVSVSYMELQGQAHTQAGGMWAAQAVPFLAARFAGQLPSPVSCASLNP